MDRDPLTGRFWPGNRASVGNKGNRNPKWGNQNAVKHGFYRTVAFVDSDGWLVIGNPFGKITRLPPDTFIRNDDGSVLVREDILSVLSEYSESIRSTTLKKERS